ncbi:MAG: hypothetical protein NTV94_06905 [Planctomycetota bacterium]|nr:hypothetical protein [Planctomycetota bacterium]
MRTSLRVHSPDSGSGSSPMIRPAATSIGPVTQPKPAAGVAPEPPPPKIVTFEQKLGARKHEDSWSRTPNSPGTGAIHVKSFHSKMNDDSLIYMDQQINEWLDAHPQYEVKLVTSSVGELLGKMGKEVHMVVQVWV